MDAINVIHCDERDQEYLLRVLPWIIEQRRKYDGTSLSINFKTMPDPEAIVKVHGTVGFSYRDKNYRTFIVAWTRGNDWQQCKVLDLIHSEIVDRRLRKYELNADRIPNIRSDDGRKTNAPGLGERTKRLAIIAVIVVITAGLITGCGKLN